MKDAEEGSNLFTKFFDTIGSALSKTVNKYEEAVKGVVSAEDKTQKTFGTVRTTYGETGAKKYATILIISQEPIELEHSISNIKASCRKDVPQEKVPGTTYTVNP